MGLFDKIFGTSDKIKVHFIDNSNGQTIGASEMNADQLPETFSVPTTMHIQDADWNIDEAIPENAVDFIKSKSLVLKMSKVEKMNPNDIWYTTPTISNEFPQTKTKTKESELDINIHEDDYRQKEFLNSNAQAIIKEEFIGIKNIRENHSKKSEEYTLFKKCHVRTIIGTPNLIINFNELKGLLKSDFVGQVIISDEILKNGFALKTNNATYFGTLDNETVTELCIAQWNENTISDIIRICKAFNLVFVNWNNCEIVKND